MGRYERKRACQFPDPAGKYRSQECNRGSETVFQVLTLLKTCQMMMRRSGDALASLRFWVLYAERIDRNAFHHLIFQRSVGIIGVCGGDLVHDIQSFNHFSKRRISAVQMRACLVHDKEVWSRKTAYLLDILSFLEFVDNKLTKIFVLNSTE